MSQSDVLLDFIGEVYDAALDDSLWPGILQKSCAIVGGSMANLFSQDTVNKSANRFYTWGDDPHYSQLYMERYATMNPLWPAGSFFPTGEVYGLADIVPHEDVRKSRFFKEWMKPQGIIDFAGCNLEKSGTSVAPLAIVRREPDGYLTPAARRRMAQIVPHIRRSLLIGKVIDRHKVEAAAMADTLDGLAAGMFLVDGAGRVVHANVAGHRLIDQDHVLRATGGRLGAIDPAANQSLQDTFAACQAGDAAVGDKGIEVALPAREGEHFVAHVLPLTSAQRRRAGASYSAVAALFVREAALKASSPMEAFVQRFNLTGAEFRVLLTIVNVGGVAEAANTLGIGEGTVRTHLHRLFEKTGTKRQADLVKLVAASMSPLAM